MDNALLLCHVDRILTIFISAHSSRSLCGWIQQSLLGVVRQTVRYTSVTAQNRNELATSPRENPTTRRRDAQSGIKRV